MLFLKPLSGLFFIIYTICGITDIMDGYTARKLNCTSSKGAMFDSVADFLFCAVMLVIFIPTIKLANMLIIWIVIIILIRMSSIIIGFYKYHSIAFLHTLLNKITGMAVFLFPYIYKAFDLSTTAIVLCFLASISAAEELTIIIKADNINRDIKSIFKLNNINFANNKKRH